MSTDSSAPIDPTKETTVTAGDVVKIDNCYETVSADGRKIVVGLGPAINGGEAYYVMVHYPATETHEAGKFQFALTPDTFDALVNVKRTMDAKLKRHDLIYYMVEMLKESKIGL